MFDDADIDRALQGALAANFVTVGKHAFVRTGFVQRKVYENLSMGFRLLFQNCRLVLGLIQMFRWTVNRQPGTPESSGYCVDAVAVEEVAVGGNCNSMDGRFFPPTVLTKVTPEMRLGSEEIFGPVAPIFRFESEDEVLRLANQTDFGLASYFYSQDINRCFRVAEAVECGMVGINTGMLSTVVAPFGGVKSSGVGREGGRYGLDEYQELKYICFGDVR